MEEDDACALMLVTITMKVMLARVTISGTILMLAVLGLPPRLRL